MRICGESWFRCVVFSRMAGGEGGGRMVEIAPGRRGDGGGGKGDEGRILENLNPRPNTLSEYRV